MTLSKNAQNKSAGLKFWNKKFFRLSIRFLIRFVIWTCIAVKRKKHKYTKQDENIYIAVV